MPQTITQPAVSAPEPALMGLARVFRSAGITSATIASWDQPGVPRPPAWQALADALSVLGPAS